MRIAVPPSISPSFLCCLPRWISTSPISNLRQLLRRERTGGCSRDQASLEIAFVSALKACITNGYHRDQLHSFTLKSGIDSNVYVRNSLINLHAKSGCIASARRLFDFSTVLDSASWNIMIAAYVRSGDLGSACKLFDEMGERDCVSFTTMIMGLAQNNLPLEAIGMFKTMRNSGVAPTEVTLATVISACSSLGNGWNGRAVHAVSTKYGLHVSVLVSTNLVHMYAAVSCLREAECIFNQMEERNIVSWNVMLNAYSKNGLADAAKDLFDRSPVQDLISWSTLVDAYVRAHRTDEALGIFRDMLRAGVVPNEVTLVDLLSACGRSPVNATGWQFHGMIIKSGLDCHAFVQTTIIHYYASHDRIQESIQQFQYGCKDHVSPWNALIAGFVRNSMTDSAIKLFNDMPIRDVVSWSTIIGGCVQAEQYNWALNLFEEMISLGLKPNEITMVSVVSAIAHMGILQHGIWVHEYLYENSISLNDNLIAGLVDMYAKCGNVQNAVNFFYQVEHLVTSVSPRNAIICALAMHGHAYESLKEFAKLLKSGINPNSITFIGVLGACCHAGLVETGKQIFEKMKNVYKIEPTIKHYGCMVDLLGRTGRLEDAERLVRCMPMKADVIIWGSLLAACKTYGNVEIGERAAKNLAALEPAHGGGGTLLSNMYAEAGKWDEVSSLRETMTSRGLNKVAGCSGVV